MSEKKRIMDETKLKQLELAREKANMVRKAQKEFKEKENALKVLEKEKQKKEIESKIDALTKHNFQTIEKPVPQTVEPKVKPKKQPKVIIMEESSSDDEPEIIYRKIKKVSKPKEEPLEKEGVIPITEHHLSQAQYQNEMNKIRRELAKKMMFSSNY